MTDSDERAIVPPEGLDARRNPDAAEPPALTLSGFGEVVVLERRGGWARVGLPDGSGGDLWVDGQRLLEPGSAEAQKPPEPAHHEGNPRVGAGTGCLLAAVGVFLFFVGALGAGLSSDSMIYDTSDSGSGGSDPLTNLWLLGSAALVIYGLYKAFSGRRPPRANRKAEYERLQRDARDQFPSSPFEVEEWPGEEDS